MPELTDDELTILMIADKGEPMLAIGRWEQPVKSLLVRGFLYSVGTDAYAITSAGRIAIEGFNDV